MVLCAVREGPVGGGLGPGCHLMSRWVAGDDPLRRECVGTQCRRQPQLHLPLLLTSVTLGTLYTYIPWSHVGDGNTRTGVTTAAPQGMRSGAGTRPSTPRLRLVSQAVSSHLPPNRVFEHTARAPCVRPLPCYQGCFHPFPSCITYLWVAPWFGHMCFSRRNNQG